MDDVTLQPTNHMEKEPTLDCEQVESPFGYLPDCEQVKSPFGFYWDRDEQLRFIMMGEELLWPIEDTLKARLTSNHQLGVSPYEISICEILAVVRSMHDVLLRQIQNARVKIYLQAFCKKFDDDPTFLDILRNVNTKTFTLIGTPIEFCIEREVCDVKTASKIITDLLLLSVCGWFMLVGNVGKSELA